MFQTETFGSVKVWGMERIEVRREWVWEKTGGEVLRANCLSLVGCVVMGGDGEDIAELVMGPVVGCAVVLCDCCCERRWGCACWFA